MSDIPSNQVETKKTYNIRDGCQYQPNSIYGRPFIDHYMRDVWQYLNSCKKSFKASKSMISKMTGLSKRKIDLVIGKLEKHNLIRIKRTSEGKIHSTNSYELIKPEYWVGSAPDALGGCTPCTRGSAPDAPKVVHGVHPKNTKEKTNKNTNVEGGAVDNFENPYTKEEFRDIFELINPIHVRVHQEKAGCIAKYYIRLLKKNEVGTLNLIEKYRIGVKNGSRFDKSIRMNQGLIVFDTAFKRQFEKDLK